MTTRWGRRLGSARTAVDLAVPRSPRMRTPPIAGLIALWTSAVFIASCPTSAVKGSIARPRAIDLILPAGRRCETERVSARSRMPVVEERAAGVQLQPGGGRAHGPVTGTADDGPWRLRRSGGAGPLHPCRTQVVDGSRRLIGVLSGKHAETGRIRLERHPRRIRVSGTPGRLGASRGTAASHHRGRNQDGAYPQAAHASE